MHPIKRTKFKLAPEQLLEMFHWLKLIRAFDERLSILVKQGKVRSGVYTGIGQEAIIVGTCYGLRKEDYICPLHRDLGAFLMKGVEPKVMMAQMFAKDTGLSKGRDSATARISSNARPIAGTATPSTTRRSIGRTKSWRCGRAAIRFRRSRPTCARATCSTIRNRKTSRRKSPRQSTRRSSSR